MTLSDRGAGNGEPRAFYSEDPEDLGRDDVASSQIRGINDQGYGFWFRLLGYGFAWSVVGPNYRPIFSERYSGQHGISKRHIVYIPVGFNKRWRLEWLTP